MDSIDPTAFGAFVLHLGIILGVAANLVILIRFIRNGKDKR